MKKRPQFVTGRVFLTVSMLQDVNGFIAASNKPKDTFKRLTGTPNFLCFQKLTYIVLFEESAFVVSLLNNQIFIVKKPAV